MKKKQLRNLVTFVVVLLYSTLTLAQSKNKILIVVTNNKEAQSVTAKGQDTLVAGGYELSEVSRAYQIFTENGFQVDFMSPQGGATFAEPESKPDSLNVAFMKNTQVKSRLDNTLSPAFINSSEYKAIYFAGGKTMWDFPDSKEMAELTAKIYENGGIVGAVCHGPAALVNVKLADGSYLVTGKKVSCLTNLEEKLFSKATKFLPFSLETKLQERGANFQEASVLMEQVVVDGRLVTGQNPMSTYAVAEEIVKILGKTPKARKLNAMEGTLDILKVIIYKGYAQAVKKQFKANYLLDNELLYNYATYSQKGILGDLNKSKAIDMLRFIVHTSPNNANAYKALATAYEEQGLHKEAIKVLKRGAKIIPELNVSLEKLQEE